jgi:hypothetical protein
VLLILIPIKSTNLKTTNFSPKVEELTVLAPGLFPSKPKQPVAMPTPPVRRKVNLYFCFDY